MFRSLDGNFGLGIVGYLASITSPMHPLRVYAGPGDTFDGVHFACSALRYTLSNASRVPFPNGTPSPNDVFRVDSVCFPIVVVSL